MAGLAIFFVIFFTSSALISPGDAFWQTQRPQVIVRQNPTLVHILEPEVLQPQRRGSFVHLTCGVQFVSHLPPGTPYRVEWKIVHAKNEWSTVRTENHKTRIHRVCDGDVDTKVLVIPHVDENDRRTYGCNIVLGDRSYYYPVRLTIGEPRGEMPEYETQIVEEGGTADLSCIIRSGRGTAEWSYVDFTGQPVKLNPKDLPPGFRMSANGQVLTISNMAKEDRANYICEVSTRESAHAIVKYVKLIVRPRKQQRACPAAETFNRYRQ